MSEITNAEMITNAKSGDIVDLDLIPIIIRIPKDSAHLNINASIVGTDGETKKVSLNWSVSDIFEARKDFIDNVGDDDYDARYVLTDEGRAYLEELRKKHGIQ